MALGNVVARLLVRLGIDKKDFDAGANDAKAQTRGLVSSLNEVRGASDLMSGALQAAGALGLAYMAREAISTAYELGKLGAQSLRMQRSFDDLAGRIDETGASLLSSLKVASRGTVSEMDLMQVTAGLLASGIQTSANDITDAMEIARLKAQQFGLTTTEAYNRMVTGARKFSVEMLDEIGINLRAESVYQRRADALGIATSALTDAQKAEALWQAILEDGRAELAEYGPATDDFVDDIQRAEVAVSELKTAIAEEFAPAVAGAARSLATVLAAITGNLPDYLAPLVLANQEAGQSFEELAAAAAGIKGEELLSGPLAGLAAPILTLAEALGFTIPQLKLTGDQLIALGNATGATIDEIRDAAAALGIDLGDAFIETDAEAEIFMGTLYKLPSAVNTANGALDDHEAKLHRLTLAYMGLSDETRKWMAERTETDIAGMDPYETVEGQLSALDAVDRQREDNATREERRVTEYERQWQTALDNQQRAYDELRSTIESALQATTVTPLDMGLTGLGEYVDKWDENARRLDAIAARGFAELDAHPDWAAVLEIPANVLAAGEEALKSWASQTAADVRNLFRPDLLNVEAAADAVQAYMQEQASKELSIDLVIGELVARGGMTQADAEAQVRQAYGLETEPVDIPIKLVSAVSGDGGEGWGAAAEELVQGLKAGITGSSLVAEFVSYFRADITNNETLLNSAGEALWDTVEVGILVRLDRADYATMFVSKLGPLVGTWLLENQRSTQGEGNP